MIPFPKRKYQIIYADPPWDFGGMKLNAATGGEGTYRSLPDYDRCGTARPACADYC